MPDQIKGGLLSPYLRSRRIAQALPYIRGRVLDVGCGVGALARWCLKDGYLGVDSDPDSVKIATLTQPDYRFFTVLPKKGEFDTIVGLAVIEHVSDPLAWLRELVPLLASDGKIVLTTPYPSYGWVHSLGGKLGLFSNDAAQEHETLLDSVAVRQVADGAGLRVLVEKRFLFGANQLFVLDHAC